MEGEERVAVEGMEKGSKVLTKVPLIAISPSSVLIGPLTAAGSSVRNFRSRGT